MLAIRSGTLAEVLVGQVPEPAFDLVEPRRRGRCEVQVEPRVPVEPPLHVLVFVGRVVVQDQMNLEPWGHFTIDGLEERQELLVTMPGQALTDDLPGQHIQSSEQRGRAVTFVVVRHRRGTTRLHR